MEEKTNYSLKEKVLLKWSSERLTLSPNENNEIEAKFVYDGTTCSSIGFPLKFEYLITLTEQSGDYTITDLDCQPAKGDIGHTKTCEYLKQGDELLQTIKNERYLVGQSINELIKRDASFHPSGCYCDQNGRDYKWHQIVQVLHFALNQEKVETDDQDNLVLKA